MGETLRMIMLSLPIMAGAIAILFSFQVMKRYGLPFTGSYFYYLIFLYIFGVYSLIGSSFLEQLFIRMETNQDTIHSTRLFMILLGIPLIALSKYMLLRSLHEFFNRKIHMFFTLSYFLAAILALVFYGIYVFRLTWLEKGDYTLLIHVQHWVFFGFMVLIYTGSYLRIILFSRSQTGNYEKRFIRSFGALYLIFMVLCCTFFTLINQSSIIPLLFIFVFLSWHLIPILFMSLYFEKYYGRASTVETDFEMQLKAFTEKFEISKRESEVIQLICKGLSNREIGDALYISLQTVKDHVHHIFIKTGVKNRVQLTNLIRARR